VLARSQADRRRGGRRERDGDDLAALAGDDQSAVTALGAQGLDAATVASDTRSPLRASSKISACPAVVPSPAATSAARARCCPARWRETHSPGGTGGHALPGMAQQLLSDGIPVEPRDRPQPARDGRAGAAAGFQGSSGG
jgi:hypothetical protein